ncbi:YDG domain-containing protein [Sphingomonas sp. LB-2]|uniref:YDG domain-containing protein n=1 Tax=Sphingomonas caeni TaxID=2984949 RepID=UPI00222E37FA|nr:YDG domain-containing protein [Sphingomonas caeni]MCW3849493.1 YDG domain-containing protein [Sphingomonas caeni]
MTNPAKLRTALCSTTAIAAALLFAAAPAAAQNLPDTGNVTTTTGGLSGGAPGSTTPTFSTSGAPGGQTLRVDLRDNRTILNWGGSGFDIGAGNTVDFKDSRATSGVTGRTDNIAVLNRDLSGGASNIAGNLRSDSNVSVYLINTNGIMFGNGAAVNTGSFLASGLDMTDADFLDGNGQSSFSGLSASNATITVRSGATLQASGSGTGTGERTGDVVLLAPKITAQATSSLLAPNGDVGIVGATDVRLQNAPGSPLSFTVNRGTGVTQAITLSGSISGRNVLAALFTRGNVATPEMFIDGTITATGATATDRGIVLTAGSAAPGVTLGSPASTAPGADIQAFGTISAVPTNQANASFVSAKDISFSAAEWVSVAGISAAGTLQFNGARTTVYGSFGVKAADINFATSQTYIDTKTETTVGDISFANGSTVTIRKPVTSARDIRGESLVRLDAGSANGDLLDMRAGRDIIFSADRLALSFNVIADGKISLSNDFAGASSSDALFYLTLNSAGDITIRSRTVADGYYATSANGVLSVTGTNVVAVGLSGGGGVSLTATDPNGEVRVNSITASGANADVTISAGGAITNRNSPGLNDMKIVAGRDVLLTVRSAASAILDTVQAGRNVSIHAGSIRASGITATTGHVEAIADAPVGSPNGGSLWVRDGNVRAGTYVSASGTSVAISGVVSAAAGDITLTATNGSLTLQNASASGAVTLTSGGTVDGRTEISGGATAAGGDLIITGKSVSLGNFLDDNYRASGAVTITATTGSVSTQRVTIQSNSDGVGEEPLTISAGTGLTLATLLGGSNRQSDVRLRSSESSAVSIGSVTARSLLGATGNNPFENGIIRNFTIRVDNANLVNSLILRGSNVTVGSSGESSFGNIVVSNGNIELSSNSQVVLFGSINASGDITVKTSSGNIRLDKAIPPLTMTTSITGRNVVLSTPDRFINFAGANAVTANGGHWVIYSGNPANNTFGGLNSGNTAIWGSTLATRAPDSVSGNRYVFSVTPTLTVSAVNFTKTYGDDLTFPAGQTQLYTITGFNPGVANAFLGDSAGSALSGGLVISSGGLAMRASVAGGPYPITISQGTLTSPTGYAIAISNTPASITVNPKALAITYLANNKFYDGTTAGTGTVQIDGIVAGDTVNATGTTWTFDGKNAANGRTVTVAGTAIGGADIGNYTFTLPSGTVLADIRKVRLNVNINANDKTYDGTVAATGTVSLLGVVGTEDVRLTGGRLEFVNKNAAGDRAVNLVGNYALTGADVANYELDTLTSGHAAIFQKAIGGTVTANSRTYDGSTAGTGTVTLNGVIVGDAVTASAIFTFDNRNAGTGKTVTVSGASLGGADAGNYTLSGLPATVLADIFKKALTATVTATSRTYDGTTAATGTVTLNGVVANDAVGATGTVFTFDNRNAGTGKTVTVSGTTTLTGADAGNYTLSGLPATVLADIFKKALTGTVTANGKTYDGNTNGTGTVALNGVVGGDAVTASAIFTFDNRNAGTGKTVTVSGASLGGADAGNYTLSGLPATVLADIFKKALTGTVTANSRTYDGTAGATGTVTLNGAVSGDAVGTSGSVFSFADKNAGTGRTVTVTGTVLTGADAGNYTLSVGTGLADIFRKALTGTVTANSRTYDGTATTTGTVTLVGVVGGDTVGTAGSVFSFADKNAGTGRTVTVTGTTLTGADAGNYTLSVGTGLADILRKALTGTVTVNSKTYDGTTTGTGTVTLGGLVSGDSVGTTGTVFTFADKNAGTGKTVTISGTTSLTGADAGNYTLTPLADTALGDILKKALTLGVTVNSRTYNGTTGATGTVTLNGVVGNEDVGVTGTTLSFADKNAGTNKQVNVTGATLTGTDSGNYTLTLPTNAVGTILKLGITGTVTVNNKTYDGNSAGTGTVTLIGVLQGDSVGTTGTVFTFADKNAGAGKTVTITGTTLNGADGGNYTLTLPASALADILRKSITGTVTITSRQYDGSTAATGTVALNGVVAGDTVTTSGTVLTFADKNAGTGKTVTVSGTTLGGADAGNYTLTMPASAFGDILRRAVSVSADNKDKYRDDADPLLTFTISSGSLVAGDSFTGGLVRAPGEAPGSYAITIGSLSLGNNYTITFSPGVLTIQLNPAENQQQVLKSIPLPSQASVPATPGTEVVIDKDALCGEDAGCVVQ